MRVGVCFDRLTGTMQTRGLFLPAIECLGMADRAVGGVASSPTMRLVECVRFEAWRQDANSFATDGMQTCG